MIKNRRELFSFSWTCASLAGLAFLAGCASMPVSSPKSTGWIKNEVADSYVFGYPLVLMDVAREAASGTDPGQAPVNTLRHAQALPPVGAGRPATPSLDTFDSTGWLDVSEEPVIVVLPDSHGRYLDARALDMWTNVIWSTAMQSGAPSSARATGVKTQTIAFVQKDWHGVLPAGAKRVDVSTRYAWFTARIQTNGSRDITAVRKLQRGIRVAPLSVFNGNPRVAVVVARPMPSDMSAVGAPSAKVTALDAAGFFGRLAQALAENPPAPDDPHALKILADLGVTPGAPVQLPAGAGDAIAAGLAEGHERIASAPTNVLTANGWSWFGDAVGNYGPDYALRAYAAYVQLGIGTKDDETRASVAQDSDGHALNGANRYVIHFAANQLPPVRGFWSLTAYTKDGAPGETTPPRVAVGDRNGAKRNHDGSLDVTVSAARAKAANWLPAPRGEFQLVMRLYAPKPQAGDGSWQPPVVERQ